MGAPVNTTHTAGGFVDSRDAENLLHQYSEWLDADQKLMARENEEDKRTHDDLVKEFVRQRNPYSAPYLEARI